MTHENQPGLTTRLPGNGIPIASHDGAPLLAREGSVWTITLNRPSQHNRLDPTDVAALHEVFDKARAAQPSLLVITGSGQRSFSSGYTVSAIANELDDRFEAMLDSLETLPFVTLAALNGSVYGGATDLALCCDIRIGVTGMRMFMPAARFGLHYYPGGMRRYVSRLGLSTASRLMLTGIAIEADEMLRVGFLGELVDSASLDERVHAYALACEQTEPGVVAAMKQQLQALASQQTDAQIAALSMAMLESHQRSVRSDELRERVANTTKK